jgi:transposase
MLSIGIDWADTQHDVCIRDLGDRRILSEFCIDHNAEGMAQLDETVTALGAEPEECRVALETPHGRLVGYLLQAGYIVYAIPPRAVDRYRDRHRQSGAKTDERDAQVLADILCIDRDYHQPMPADSALVQEIQATSRQRQSLVAERTRIKNQLTACLKSYYPVALELFSDLSRAIAWAFLRAYPNAEAASAASLAELEAFFAQQGYSCPRKIPEIYEQLHAPAIPVAPWQVRTAQRHMLVLVELLATLVAQIKAYQRALRDLLDQHPDAFIFRSLPGVGDVTAAWLLGEIGDCRDKFESANQMQALAGTCPVTVQSGNRRLVKFRVGCCKPFRNGMQQFARLSVTGPKGSSWARGYLSDQLARGHSMSRGTRALANRWLAIIFRLWQDRVVYDERIHLRNRAQHGRRVMA